MRRARVHRAAAVAVVCAAVADAARVCVCVCFVWVLYVCVGAALVASIMRVASRSNADDGDGWDDEDD